ncbi:hypothetical protein LEP1GSC068_0202 [Leptospira sp. Fiocruz LV3954]|nr:hypothetical protein LEP1GSC068_0202 [Leptospira sp. Fiocruz LV3954]
MVYDWLTRVLSQLLRALANRKVIKQYTELYSKSEMKSL